MLSPLVFYKCLSEDTRLNALLLITLKKELCVCDLTQALGVSQPKISRHLAELRKCEILMDERRGKWVYYRLHPTLPNWASEVLEITANTEAKSLRAALSAIKGLARVCC